MAERNLVQKFGHICASSFFFCLLNGGLNNVLLGDEWIARKKKVPR